MVKNMLPTFVVLIPLAISNTI